jgi:hypothetical protein
MAMVWLIVCSCTVAVALASGWLIWRRSRRAVAAGMYQVSVALHIIRRRFDMFQFKVETRWSHTNTWRRLSKELRDLERREHRP